MNKYEALTDEFRKIAGLWEFGKTLYKMHPMGWGPRLVTGAMRKGLSAQLGLQSRIFRGTGGLLGGPFRRVGEKASRGTQWLQKRVNWLI